LSILARRCGGKSIRTAEVFRPPEANERLRETLAFADLGRGRSCDVNVCLGFRFRRRRRIHNGSALLLLGRRIRYRGFFLLTGREERGTNQDADVFVHKC
jgi:hypothetical protein